MVELTNERIQQFLHEETLKTEESSEYLNKAKIDIVNITKDFLGKIKMRDMIVKISRTNRLINSLKNKLRRDR